MLVMMAPVYPVLQLHPLHRLSIIFSTQTIINSIISTYHPRHMTCPYPHTIITRLLPQQPPIAPQNDVHVFPIAPKTIAIAQICCFSVICARHFYNIPLLSNTLSTSFFWHLFAPPVVQSSLKKPKKTVVMSASTKQINSFHIKRNMRNANMKKSTSMLFFSLNQP